MHVRHTLAFAIAFTTAFLLGAAVETSRASPAPIWAETTP